MCQRAYLDSRDKSPVIFEYEKGEITLMNDMNDQACDLQEVTSALPNDPVPAMAYVPFQQWNSSLLSAERALDAGTLFPVLDKPFYGGRREPR